jgi:hypothetical protein
MVAVPVAWAVLLLFHPTGEGDEVYPVVRDQVTAWLVVHVGTLLFVPLLACVVYLLLRGVEDIAALVSRIAQQIAHGARREAQHPVELVRRALAP